MKNNTLKATRKYILAIFSLFLIGIFAFLLSHSKFSFKQYTRLLKEHGKASEYVQRFSFSVEEPFFHKDPSLPDSTLQRVLKQPFVFLAKGKQTEVYASADGGYVLRCLTAKKKAKLGKIPKSSLLLRRALLAWNEVREETGLLAIGAMAREARLPTVTLLSPKGLLVQVPLSETSFFIQKRAIPFKTALVEAKFQQDRKRMEALITSLFSLLSSLREKGIIDLDGALIRNGNLGVIGSKVILLDIGKLEHCHNKVEQTKKDLNRLRPLHHWLLTLDPDFVSFFLKSQEKYKLCK